MISFYSPYAFLLLIPVAGLLAWRFLRWRKKDLRITFPSFIPLEDIGVRKSTRLRWIPWILRIAVIILLVIVIARPQAAFDEKEVHTQGIDIVLALDISSSMLAEDFQPKNRIIAAKEVAKEFISGRHSDRIGLVVFAGESYTQCPLTLDYELLKEFMDRVDVGAIEDGTAIGMAIANGLNRLRDSQAESKVIILLTDGQNNRGEIDPLTAAQAATPLHVKIYTIGVGTEGTAPYPVQTPYGIRYQQIPVKIDEDLLKEVASITGGKYFRALDENKLRDIYKIIDEMETSEIEVKEYRSYSELFLPWAIAALVFLMLEVVLVSTRLRMLPSGCWYF
ncbi:MAG: VWA domain-containing protein [FCB group bacterium]|nr:VWA domain-containing protein [FCB group bacterium]